MHRFTLHHGDCLEVLKTMPSDSVHSVVTDPPYGLSFMGKKWDYDVPSVEIWQECLRVLKPGGHLLAFAGTRTQHRMAIRIEDAGFEIRDMIAWVYGSGFPKSHNLKGDWEGWGTALKPALEPITMARKPLIKTVADNVLTHGTGALNIDGTRITSEKIKPRSQSEKGGRSGGMMGKVIPRKEWTPSSDGRFPANFIHDGSQQVLSLFPNASKPEQSQARFFYCPKASKHDRDEGLDGFEVKQYSHDGCETRNETAYQRNDRVAKNNHPTVKPTDLMRYLCRLVTPADGIVLDPFTGSGSTGKAALLEGFQFIGIEREAEYIKIAQERCQILG